MAKDHFTIVDSLLYHFLIPFHDNYNYLSRDRIEYSATSSLLGRPDIIILCKI